MDREYPQGEKTVLLDRQGQGPVQGPITDFASPPRFEQLDDRMIYAARLQGAEHFNVGLNNLVAPAWELLSEVVRLKRSTAQESLRALNERLSSAITLFETRARHDGAQSSEVMAARYVLCSVIDEAVVTTPWGNQSDWSKMSLLSSFHNETFGGEKFFQLLERMSRDPFKHLAMLELMYLCLSLGFEGKYRIMERGLMQLEQVRDALYRQIRHVRGEPPPACAPPSRPSQQRQRSLRMVPASWVAMFVVACLVGLYSGFAWVLGEQRETALQPYQLLAPDLSRTPL
ncbi:type IVB secretion system protein IcmH/DotU [Pseudomonas sp. Bout1]|uniref:type IVB secretion system protein IcmH/DotU n=1 Tax=Pseudomonas sp. Bout1 TaxID=3048600 RepID=UPI002AB55722|nr:type IVB secretion system protein IcmH/DotU [Pseudomonas sp. Bout1]MDY7532749.1 type IVB secretion system protein IcmH/DotU [Pseudomonas sp. Bout1]MEB0185132.1 type IVB secretion system protein IcmH/DotU [Pseudomonas sp. Bout1]